MWAVIITYIHGCSMNTTHTHLYEWRTLINYSLKASCPSPRWDLLTQLSTVGELEAISCHYLWPGPLAVCCYKSSAFSKCCKIHPFDLKVSCLLTSILDSCASHFPLTPLWWWRPGKSIKQHCFTLCEFVWQKVKRRFLSAVHHKHHKLQMINIYVYHVYMYIMKTFLKKKNQT